MVQQDTSQALLAAALAVRQGLVAPNSAAAALAESVTMRGRDWFQLLVEWQLLNQTLVESLKIQLAAELAGYSGDTEQALRQTPIDERLRKELERFQLPRVSALLQLTPVQELEDSETSMSDRYETLPSHTPSELGESVHSPESLPVIQLGPDSISQPPAAETELGLNDDPYTTGAVISSLSADSSAGTAAVPGTGSATPTNAPAITGSHAIKTPSPLARTNPEHRVIKSESILQVEQPADYATQAPVTPNFESLEQSTVPPKGDYATLKSGLAAGAQQHSRPQPDDDDATAQTQRFRVLREHAKGGLGKVSVAEDLELHREVAFKEIQRRYSSDQEARARFLLEAEITGGLEHPGIVPVYGLGTHGDGRPYYAMRFIRGRTLQQGIEQYYRSTKQGTDAGVLQIEFRQLLRRFTDVCNAIEYAHSRGIIHRDIKPGNIMLGDYGETLVVDWGIAKSVTVTGSLFKASLMPLQPRMGSDASQTVMGVAIGTPQFMSPEQAKGQLDELGPPSDVYSLGATLYCLLTGVAAFTSREVNTVINQVKLGTFPPPIQLNTKLPKPLNAICLKAMSLQPALRYQSARALSEDIEHWLADEPVAAYEENRWERASRWIRHHQAKAQAIGVSVIVIALVSTIAAFLIDQSRRAEKEALEKQKIATKNEAEARANESKAKQEALRRSRDTREAIDTLLVGVSDALLEVEEFPGIQDTRRRLLERATVDYGKLAKETSPDAGLQLEAGRSLLRLGDVYSMLNSIDKARSSYEQVNLLSGHGAVDSQLASNFLHLQGQAKTQLGTLENRAGKHVQAVAAFNDAIAILRQVVGNMPNRTDFQIALGRAQIGLGKALQADGKLTAAATQLQQALLAFQNLRKGNPKDLNVLSATADVEAEYARYLIDDSQPAAAVRMFEDSIKVYDDLIQRNPRNAEYLGQRATAYISLADALKDIGEWPRAVRNNEGNVEDLQGVVRAKPDIPKHRENLAVARRNLGHSLRRLGRNTDALPVLQKAVEEFNELAASYPVTRLLENLANARTALAQLQSELGQHDAALETINLAVANYQELQDLQADSIGYFEGLGVAQRHRGRILARRGDVAGGVQALEESIKLLKTALEKQPKVGRINDHLAWAWWSLGLVQFAAGQTEPAKTAFQEATKIREQLVLSHGHSPQYRDTLAWQMATCPIEELRRIKRALELSLFTTRSFNDSTQFWLTRGVALILNGDAKEALTALEKSATLRTVDDGLTLCFLAITEAKLDKKEEAQKHLMQAKAWQQAQKPTDEELSYWIKQAEAAVGMK